MADNILSDITPLDLSGITDTDPIPVAALNALGWYETEETGLTVDNLSDADSPLPWLLAQGWQIKTMANNRVVVEGEVTSDKTTYTFDRRKLKAEEALQQLINQTTTAYNDGRTINDQRYDDLVTLYTLYISNTESSLGQQSSIYDTYKVLIETLLSGIKSEYSAHKSDTVAAIANYGTSRRQKIESDFKFKESEAINRLNAANMGSSILIDGIISRYENEKQQALNDLEDKIAQMKLNNNHTLFQELTDVNSRVMAAHERLQQAGISGQMGRLEFQMRIVMAMFNFMKERDDTYPDLGAISNMAAQFGSANSTEVSP